MALFGLHQWQNGLCQIACRGYAAVAAPAVKKAAPQLPEYFLYLDEETLRSAVEQKAEMRSPPVKPPPEAKKETHPTLSVPSAKEAVVFDFGARITCHMAPNENVVRSRQGRPARAADPFEGIPFRGLAEFLGGSYMDAVDRAREEDERLARERGAGEDQTASVASETSSAVPPVPRFLPFTAAFAATDAFKDTFVVDDDKAKRRTRLSWYDPTDGMVPRGWLADGLLADLDWYRPFKQGNGWREV
mmetsp:Transcript_9093/g.32701  ORF Transcript_9093/g.32701 Transcript_9093/m.32701 type:complete len:246 (-) Transcript_9093:1542-2279(-)